MNIQNKVPQFISLIRCLLFTGMLVWFIVSGTINLDSAIFAPLLLEVQMGPLALKREERFTYGDYVTWDDDEQWELIDGVPYNMSPALKVAHQRILED